MVARAVFISLLFLLSPGALAAVAAQLSAQEIDELESVRLVIRASETRQTETLDLSALNQDFHVMGTNTSSQYRFVNGREQSWVDYQITLQPKRVGTLQIPSITVGRDQTPTMTLRVRKLSDATRARIDKMVYFESDVSAEEIYVQAQLILTRRLLYSEGVQLYSDLPGAPEVENAVVLTLGETKAGSTQRDGQTYGVIEQKYAIFPEASGELTLPAINVTASVRLTERGRTSRKGVRVGTEPVSVTVLPVPESYPRQAPWLPAVEVSALQVLEPTGEAAVGDTLTHELVTHIIGNVGSAAPPQELDVQDSELRRYPQAPVIDDDTNGTMVVGSRLQTTSIVPLQPGDHVIPSQQIYWWDTVNDELRTTSTEAIGISVTGAGIQQQADDNDAEPETISATSDIDEQISTQFDLRWLAWVLAVLVIGLLIWRARRLIPSLPSLQMGDPALRALKQSSSTEDFYRQLNNLIAQRSDVSWTDLANVSAESSAAKQKLMAAAFSANPSKPDEALSAADRKTLISAYEQLGKQKQQSKASDLPPLYPA